MKEPKKMYAFRHDSMKKDRLAKVKSFRMIYIESPSRPYSRARLPMRGLGYTRRYPHALRERPTQLCQ